jgi:serine/threonine protein kinase
MPADAKEKYHREISMMAQLDHPNILRLHEYFENESFIYLILDLCTGGNLLLTLNSIATIYYFLLLIYGDVDVAKQASSWSGLTPSTSTSTRRVSPGTT